MLAPLHDLGFIAEHLRFLKFRLIKYYVDLKSIYKTCEFASRFKLKELKIGKIVTITMLFCCCSRHAVAIVQILNLTNQCSPYISTISVRQ